jgi:hypothetical protein
MIGFPPSPQWFSRNFNQTRVTSRHCSALLLPVFHGLCARDVHNPISASLTPKPTQKGRVYNLLRLPPSSPSSSPLSNRSLPSSMPCNGEPQDISIKWLVNIKLSKTLTLPSILLCTTHVLLCCWVQTAKFNAWASSSVAHVMLLGVLRSFHPAGCISDVPKLARLERNSSTKLFSVAFLMLLALSPFSTSPFRSAFSSWTIYILYSLLASPIKVRGELFFISFCGLFLLLMDI